MKLNRSEKLLLLSVILSVLHHLDHVLRVDHSGWPLLPRMTPFTFSLLAYPIFIAVFLTRSKPWFRVAGTALLFLFATLAHLFFEPFRDKFHTWTYGSNLPGHVGEQNLLGIQSPILGVGSIVLAVLLSLSLFAALLSCFGDARKGISS